MSKESWQNPLFISFFYFHLYRKVNKGEELAIANATLDYCLNYIGQGQSKKKRPNIVFRNVKDPNHPVRAAYYNLNDNIIVLFSPHNRNSKRIVQRVIHEYGHYLIVDSSNVGEYHRTQKLFSAYVDGPHEYISDALAKKYYKDAFAFVLYKLGYCSLTRQF